MVVDLDRCIGCRTCAVICKDHNALPQGMWWNRVFVPGAPEYGTSVMVDGKHVWNLPLLVASIAKMLPVKVFVQQVQPIPILKLELSLLIMSVV